ncbi:hypothetical protein T484DRAFT_1792117, partial [Baffinella frigidus]
DIGRLDRIAQLAAKVDAFVMFTLVNPTLHQRLEQQCESLKIPHQRLEQQCESLKIPHQFKVQGSEDPAPIPLPLYPLITLRHQCESLKIPHQQCESLKIPLIRANRPPAWLCWHAPQAPLR